MSTDLSVSKILASLEAQRAQHKERENWHAEQEAFHREQRAHHAAEYERVTQNYEAFKATAETAADLAARALATVPEPEKQEEEPPPGKPPVRTRLLERMVEEIPVGTVIWPSWLAEEANRRFPKLLPKPVSFRMASNALRKMVGWGLVEVAEKGKPHHEAAYRKV
ncbi:MAG TPA: hypothetical protein VE685_14495 [Thermoanaerobaculia bacterium]|nr:hypothetical protein [Thermoanaerobaculia bacterium]